MSEWKQWTTDEDRILRDMLVNDRADISTIARRLNRTEKAVKSRVYYRRLHGDLLPNQSDAKKARFERIRELYDSGVHPTEIAKIVGYARVASVWHHIYKLGVNPGESEKSGYSYAMMNWKKAREAARKQLAQM